MSKKIVALRIITALLAALLGSWAIHSLVPELTGTALYRRLQALRPPVPVAREILLIDTSSVAWPGDGREPGGLPGNRRAAPDAFDWAEILMLMTEFEAAEGVFLFQPAEAPPSEHSLKLKQQVLAGRFDQEFSIMGGNVLAFFEAIRLGSVRPRDSVRYVDDLLQLMEQGKNRLIDEVRAMDDTEAVLVNQALKTFGRAWIDQDEPWLAAQTESFLLLHSGGRPWSKAVFDALIHRFGKVEPRIQENLLVLPEVRVAGSEVRDISVPLGRDGSVLFEIPDQERDGGFRRINPGVMLHAADLETSLYQLFKTMEGAGYLSGLEPETYPTALYEQVLRLRREMLDSPDEHRLAEWRRSRVGFFKSSADFLAGKAEKSLLDGYDELIQSETLETSGVERVEELRQAVVRAFSEARKQLSELEFLRRELDAELRGSFCIIGPGEEAEAEAGLVNALITDRFIDPLWGQRRNRWIALPGLVLSIPLAFINPLLALLAGALAATVAAGLVSIQFIFGGLWIHPVLPGAIILMASFGSAGSCLGLRLWSRYRLRTAFGRRLPPMLIRELSHTASVQTTEISRARAVVLAIRYVRGGDHGRPEEDPDQAADLKGFQDQAARAIISQGGIVLGSDGFIVLGAFGTPLEGHRPRRDRIPEAAMELSPAKLAGKACTAALAIMGPETASDNFWRFGMDIGECAFFYSDAGGYSAVGRPPVYARILSGLALKYRCRILVTQELKDAIGEQWLTRRLDTLVAKSSGREEAFFELSGQPWH